MTEAEWLKIFSANLGFYLEQSGMTQRDLAMRTGLSESAISNYINKSRFPTLRAIIKIANAFVINIDELIPCDGSID